ncbi:MAG: primosomal protein N', partial [Lachnospiraceae bacterium]|nr:primosomal protein N' [Lachnospiraceae bacterium]
MQMLYADVIVDITAEALDRPFSYIVPEGLKDAVVLGSYVQVPFGKRTVNGYVVGFRDNCDYDPARMKEILSVLTGCETAEARLIALAAWMSHTYGGVMAQSLRTVLPLKRRVNAVMEKRVYLLDGPAAEEYRDRLGKRQEARRRVIDALLGRDGQTAKELTEACQTTMQIIRGLEKDGIVCIQTAEMHRTVIPELEVEEPERLTQEQTMAVRHIRQELDGKNRPVLLKGVTGSGKTLVYMELIADVLNRGKQAIVLIPEIALTRQTVERFVRRFGDKVSFLHSRLSEGERYDQMRAAKAGGISIMVGPRSALFTPFPSLGLIVIDEEHEESYRSEMVPRYHARDVAVRRAKIEGAGIVMGSATPSLNASYMVQMGQYLGVSLQNRYGNAILPETVIVDMRREALRGNRSIFSEELRKRMQLSLSKGEQVMLFLNRRGYVGSVTCRSCGHLIKCPHCDVSLTRHLNGKLVCHYCGYETEDVRECPSCHSTYIGGISAGTEKIEEDVTNLFPQARTLRMDYDTTRGKEGHTKILSLFENGKADILIGTQMIVKGHDFPNVTCVGVLMADISLAASDYRAGERTFQLVTQAVGRAGRGDKKGCAVIQTYQPEHYAVKCAAAQKYSAFYKEEIAYRKLMNYPPTGFLLAVLGSSADEELLSVAMQYLRKYLDRIDRRNILSAIGPAPQA